MTGDDYHRPPEDPRVAQTRDLVLGAARELLVEEGVEAVTPTRLSNVTGISRSTIYRNWQDPSDIVFEATATDTGQPPFTPIGEPLADAKRYLEALRTMLSSSRATLVATRIERAEHDETTAATLRAISDDRSELIQRTLEHPPGDFSAWHALMVGPLMYQRFVGRGPITDELIDLVASAYFAVRDAEQEA